MVTIPRIAEWFGRFSTPRLKWIQIEVTSFCNAACVYCPRTAYRENWIDRHLPLSTFEKLMSSLPATDLLFLQGWGEPLMSPHFFEMAGLAKSKGLRVGTTTNGTLIDKNTAERLVETGMDVLAFSLAGAKAFNDRFRKGAGLEKVLEGINLVNQAKKRKGLQLPKLNLAYLLLRSGLDDLELLPALIAGLDINQIVISTLDFLPLEQLKDETVIPADQAEYNALAARFEKAAAECARANVDFHYQIFSPGPRRQFCSEHPGDALFVSADGVISPCVFANLPVREEFRFGAEPAGSGAAAKKRPLAKMVFGNINRETLSDIWRKKEYAAFRNSFLAGEVTSSCRDCPKLYLC